MINTTMSEDESSFMLQCGSGSSVTSVNCALDFKGRPATRSNSGGWLSAVFIIGVEMAERFAYYGVSSNLISYLTGPLGQSKAVAAENVNTWSGVAMLLPLLGAFVADSFLGRYCTVIIASIIYFLGLGLLTFSTMLPSASSPGCETSLDTMSCSGSQYQVMLFFFALYLIALGQGGHKPCLQAFGADQFDENDSEERIAKSSYFNWLYLGLCSGTASAYLFLNYIQDNWTWALGFGIPCISMMVGLIVFLIGSKTYRFIVVDHEKNPFLRIGNVFVNAARKWLTTNSSLANEEVAQGAQLHGSSPEFVFLNKALLQPAGSEENATKSRTDIEDAKALLRLVPIGVTCLAFGIVFAQSSTFFTEQALTIDRIIWSSFVVPPASLQLFKVVSAMLFIPVYDLIFVPLARGLTKEPSGITMLQRIGAGLLTSTICMVVSAIVEMRRLGIAQEYGLVDHPEVTLPMSFWWLVPQYLLLGIADVFTIVGMQEFFYDQVPEDLKSLGLSIYLCVLAIGSFLSSFLVFVIENATSGEGHDSWFSDNLNRAHLDYFYWLLSGICFIGLLGYLYFARYYSSSRAS